MSKYNYENYTNEDMTLFKKLAIEMTEDYTIPKENVNNIKNALVFALGNIIPEIKDEFTKKRVFHYILATAENYNIPCTIKYINTYYDCRRIATVDDYMIVIDVECNFEDDEIIYDMMTPQDFENHIMDVKKYKFEYMPYDYNGCHSTGRLVRFKNKPYYSIEYVDEDGSLFYL